jgi:hypothetical protein
VQSIAAIERARKDRAEGRPWKARERLRSFLTAYPADQTALDLLGEIYYEMGDLPAAGAAWFLCTRDDSASREAIAALRREHERSTRGLLGALRVRAPFEAWPPPVQERLRSIQAEAARRGVEWEPAATRADEPEYKPTVGENVALAGCLVVAVALAACTVVGLVVAAGWLLERVV